MKGIGLFTDCSPSIRDILEDTMKEKEYRAKVISDPQVIIHNGAAYTAIVIIPLSVEEYAPEGPPDGYTGINLRPLPAHLNCEAQKGDIGIVYEGGPASEFSLIPRALVYLDPAKI